MILFQADPINHFSSKILLLLLKMKAIQTSSDWNSEKEGEKSISHFPGHYLCFWKEIINNVLTGEAASCSKCIQGWAERMNFWEASWERDCWEVKAHWWNLQRANSRNLQGMELNGLCIFRRVLSPVFSETWNCKAKGKRGEKHKCS